MTWPEELSRDNPNSFSNASSQSEAGLEENGVRNEPERPNNIGKRRRIHAIDGRDRYFIVVDEIVREQRVVESGTRKLIYFQKIRFEENARIEYRLTYYMLGLRPGAKGRWVFGQYSLLIPPKELKRLLTEARRRAWPGI